jgi:hypothetical protein
MSIAFWQAGQGLVRYTFSQYIVTQFPQELCAG